MDSSGGLALTLSAGPLLLEELRPAPGGGVYFRLVILQAGKVPLGLGRASLPDGMHAG